MMVWRFFLLAGRERHKPGERWVLNRKFRLRDQILYADRQQWSKYL